MSSRVEDIVIEKVRALPPEQQHQVLEFVEQLEQRQDHTKSARPIWEEIAEISAQVPEEAWQNVPTDGSEQHDHYLYGAPKRKS